MPETKSESEQRARIETAMERNTALPKLLVTAEALWKVSLAYWTLLQLIRQPRIANGGNGRTIMTIERQLWQCQVAAFARAPGPNFSAEPPESFGTPLSLAISELPRAKVALALG